MKVYKREDGATVVETIAKHCPTCSIPDVVDVFYYGAHNCETERAERKAQAKRQLMLWKMAKTQ